MKIIVLTGGPCAGKTTALARIVQVFTSRGFVVYTLPEAATLFNQAGVNFVNTDRKVFFEAERALLDFQIQMEDHFARIARVDSRQALIVCDRGTMDIAAYMPTDVWQAILDETKRNPVELRDQRYDAVIHMCTTAKDALDYYTLDNNLSRTESPEVACQLDDRLLAAWSGHPHLRVVGNKGVDFEGKLNRVIAEIAAVLGVPEPVETERKFLVDIVDEMPALGNESEIYQTYLLPQENGVELRIRKRGENGHYLYFVTEKHKLVGAQRVEFERQITPTEYLELMQTADPKRQTIHKLRRCFVWDNQYFELDTFISPEFPHRLLELEGLADVTNITFPPFLKVLAEVTEDPRYYNANIAKRSVTEG